MTRPVLVTARAERDAAVAERWWRKNRSAAPGLFIAELEKAVDLLRDQPEVGVKYQHSKRTGIRRLLLPRAGYHLYYRIDRGSVIVLRIWHMRRGGAPAL